MITRRTVFAGLGLPAILAASPLARAGEAAEAALHADLTVLRRLEGRWRGNGEGEPGISEVARSYEAVLGGRFLLARNRSAYAPQEKNPKGETHEDMGLYSFDEAARTIVFRQFHTEGFVNHYTAPLDSLGGDVLIFLTTAIENIPPGFRARETLTFTGADNFEERFEIAEPGKAFALYSLNRLTRA